MKSKKIGILIITLITILSFSTAVQAANKVIGQKINILYGILGDVNGDKKITKEDSEAILKHITGTKRLFWLGERKRADADQDNKITSADSLAIIKYINQNNETVVNVSSISISGANTVNVGETIKLTATIKPSNATNKEIKWTSNYSIRAEVDENGIVKGKKAGKVTITAEAGGKKATYIVEVQEKEKTITMMEISKLPTKTSYNINETVDTKGLELKVTYNTGETEKVTSGFTVSPTKVTEAGQQDISVTYKGKTCKYKVQVGALSNYGDVQISTVTKMPNAMEETKESNKNARGWMTKFQGQPQQTTVNKNKNNKYTSTGAVALYYANRILGANISASEITDKYQNGSDGTYWERGNYKIENYSTYKEQMQAIYNELIKGNPVGVPVSNEKGEFQYVLIYAIPQTTTNKTKLDANDFRVIDPIDGSYQRLSKYYQHQENGKNVYRIAYLNEDGAVKSVSLKSKDITLQKGNGITIGVTVTNTGNQTVTIPKLNKITWSSSNSNVVEVDGNGKIKGKAVGTATITAKTVNGKTATCAVTVQDVYTYTLNGYTFKLAVPKSKIDSAVTKIQSNNVYQNYKYSNGNRPLAGICGAVSTYYIKFLYGKISNLTISGAQGCDTSYSYDADTASELKQAIDNGKLSRLKTKTSLGQHWAVVIGYKGNGEKFSDFLLLDPAPGKVQQAGTGTSKSLYNGRWLARVVIP